MPSASPVPPGWHVRAKYNDACDCVCFSGSVEAEVPVDVGLPLSLSTNDITGEIVLTGGKNTAYLVYNGKTLSEPQYFGETYTKSGFVPLFAFFHRLSPSLIIVVYNIEFSQNMGAVVCFQKSASDFIVRSHTLIHGRPRRAALGQADTRYGMLSLSLFVETDAGKLLQVAPIASVGTALSPTLVPRFPGLVKEDSYASVFIGTPQLQTCVLRKGERAPADPVVCLDDLSVHVAGEFPAVLTEPESPRPGPPELVPLEAQPHANTGALPTFSAPDDVDYGSLDRAGLERESAVLLAKAADLEREVLRRRERYECLVGEYRALLAEFQGTAEIERLVETIREQDRLIARNDRLLSLVCANPPQSTDVVPGEQRETGIERVMALSQRVLDLTAQQNRLQQRLQAELRQLGQIVM